MGGSSDLLDGTEFPETLTANAVDARVRPALHGYRLDSDLCGRYSFVEVVVLALTGELPNQTQGRAAEVAFAFWLPAFVGDAPAHVGVLTKVCGSRTSGTVAASATALSEESRWLISQHEQLIQWLDAPVGPTPSGFSTQSEEERQSVGFLKEAVGAAAEEIRVFRHDLAPPAVTIGLLHFAGLRRPEQLESALTIARLPGVLAEALHATAARLREYPMNLPRFDYGASR